MTIDPVTLTQALIRCPSVTPDAGAALDLVDETLAAIGMTTTRLSFGDGAPGTREQPVANLFATITLGNDDAERRNDRAHLAFNGHVDVVPTGPVAQWRDDPFSGRMIDGKLFGRGSTDMKSGVACFVAALAAVINEPDGLQGQVSLMITGDEEGIAVNGSKPLIAWADAQGYRFDGCLVGEPTSRERLGDNAKIGRRGSATAELRVLGSQGHTAYPHNARNAAHGIVAMLDAVTKEPIDDGNANFQPTSLQVTTIDIGNQAGNVIPGAAFARFNMRYNNDQNVARLEHWLRQRLDAVGERYELAIESSGDAFLTKSGPLSDAIKASVQAKTGIEPSLSTDGGTSDARFIKDYCPVVEFGLTGKTMHAIDEHAMIDEIQELSAIYQDFIRRFLSGR